MASPIERTAYTVGQGLRLGLYWSQSWLSGKLTRPVSPPDPRLGRLPDADRLREELRRLTRRDWANIAAGHYRLPHDLISAPIESLALSRRYFADLAAVERRRHAGQASEIPEPSEGEPEFPNYFLQNFHFQTDGYLSRRSARLYDHQVEVLFAGAADLMRRQILVPLKDCLETRRIAETRLLDLACGTGRFLTFVKDNYPRLPVTALDLSPAYLERAQEMLASWRGMDFVCARAEDTGLPDASQDIVTCIYLFHELPREVRQAVTREIARVLKPGGRLLFMDSLQLGDQPDFDALLRRFPVAFHEPYYADYIQQDLDALFTEAGLTVEAVDIVHLSRMMVMSKAPA